MTSRVPVALCLCSIALLFLATFSHIADASPPSLPSLPTAFSTVVEANIMERNYTINLREWVDSSGERVRLEEHRFNQIFEEIIDFQKNVSFLWEPKFQNCTSHPLTTSGNFFRDRSGRIRSASQLFFFGGPFREQYLGQSFVRGIRCDQWITFQNFTASFPIRRHVVHLHLEFNLTYSFSVESWRYRGESEHRIPVLALLNGRETNLDTSVVRSYTHYYNFVDFLAEKPLESQFVPPDYCYEDCKTNCNNRGKCVNGKCVCTQGFSGRMCETEDSKSNLGIEIAIILSITFAAVVITVIVCLVQRKKELKKYRPLDESSSNNVELRASDDPNPSV